MNVTGKYLKVWKVKYTSKGLPVLDLGDSEKQRDDTYKNWTWFGCLCVGKAAQMQFNEKDTIEIKSGIISMQEYNGKWSPKVVIFECEVTSSSGSQNNRQQNNSGFQPGGYASEPGFSDDIPY